MSELHEEFSSEIDITIHDAVRGNLHHFFRAWATYTLQIGGLNPSIVDYIRGDVANSIRGFYFNQVLPFEVIKKDYLKAVPKFGI